MIKDAEVCFIDLVLRKQITGQQKREKKLRSSNDDIHSVQQFIRNTLMAINIAWCLNCKFGDWLDMFC